MSLWLSNWRCTLKKKYALPFHNFKKIVSLDQLGFWALILNNGPWDWHLQRCTRLTLENVGDHLQLMVSDQMRSLPTLLDLAPTWPTGKSGRVGGTQQIRCWTIIEILPLIQKRELLKALYKYQSTSSIMLTALSTEIMPFLPTLRRLAVERAS